MHRIALTLAASLALAATACQRTEESPSPKSEAPTAARAAFDATLTVADNSGTVRFDGTVDSADTKTRLEQALLAAYGPGRASGAIDVDAAARPAEWVGGLATFLPGFAETTGASLRFEGDAIVLNGALDLERRRALRTAAEQAFPGARLEGLFVLPDATAGEADARPIAPQQLEKTLNTLPVAFDAGRGNVSDDSLALVAQAADAIRRAPAGTRLRIVGPVVATADAGNDVFLSKQRAEALKVQLILNGVNPATIETRGWGEAEGAPGEAAEGQPATPDTPAAPPPEGAPMRFELVR